MTSSPCRLCSLGKSDKNNPTCLKCVKRVAYVATIDRELNFASCRSELQAIAPRCPIISRQAYFLSVSPEIYYE
jgi:hypothetical protein